YLERQVRDAAAAFAAAEGKRSRRRTGPDQGTCAATAGAGGPGSAAGDRGRRQEAVRRPVAAGAGRASPSDGRVGAVADTVCVTVGRIRPCARGERAGVV